MRALQDLFGRVFGWTNSSSTTVGGAALVVAVAGILSRVLGLLRDRMLASHFGAGDTLDAYYAAFKYPDFFYGIIIVGAVSAAFIPIFSERISRGETEKAWRLTNDILAIFLLVLGSVALLGILFASELVSLFTPGFSGAKHDLTVELTRIMLLGPVFLGMGSIFGGALVSLKRFVANSLAPIFYNAGIISGIFFLVPMYGMIGLAMGVVLGTMLHAAVQYPALRHVGFHLNYSLSRAWKDRDVRRVLTLMVPRTLGVAVNQVSLIVELTFASLLVSGSIAELTLANNIQSVPLSLFGIAFSLAVFPLLSSLHAGDREPEFFAVLASTTRRILFFTVPVSLFLIIFRAQFVRVILGTGAFNWEDTIQTFEVLKWLSVSLFAQALIPLFARAFYALHDTKRPFYIALIAEAVHLALIPILIPYFSVEGLAMAFSAGSVINATLLYLTLRKRLPSWNDRVMFAPVWKILLATLVAGSAAQLSKYIFALTANPLDTFLTVLAQLAIGLGIGFSVFTVMAIRFRLEDFEALMRFVRSRLLRRPDLVASIDDHPEKGEW